MKNTPSRCARHAKCCAEYDFSYLQTGRNKISSGTYALRSNTTGSHKASNGLFALKTYTYGTFNTAIYPTPPRNPQRCLPSQTGAVALAPRCECGASLVPCAYEFSYTTNDFVFCRTNFAVVFILVAWREQTISSLRFLVRYADLLLHRYFGRWDHANASRLYVFMGRLLRP